MPLYKSSNPSTGLMRKIFGDPMSESTQKDYPELARAWASAQVRMPRETSNVNSVTADLNDPDYLGMYTPYNGRININKKGVTESNNLREVLVHETTHAGQSITPKTIVEKWRPWAERQEEIEAMRMGAINPIRERNSDKNLSLREGDRRDPRLPESNNVTYSTTTSIKPYRLDPSLDKEKKLMSYKRR